MPGKKHNCGEKFAFWFIPENQLGFLGLRRMERLTNSGSTSSG